MTYVTEVLADSPIHYWRLADPGGFIAHDIGSTKFALTAAHYLGSLPYLGPNTDGGSAFMTNAAGFVSVDQQTLVYPVTLEAWVWHTQRKGSQQNVFSTEAGSGAGSFSLAIDGTGHPQCTSDSSALTSATPITKYVWHHLVAVHTGSVRNLYVDAVLVATDSQSLVSTTSEIGLAIRPFDSANYLEGCISECAMYSFALSSARVTAHFLAADDTASRPVYRTSGTWNGSDGSSTVTQDTLDAILAAVRRTFPTT